MFDLDNFDLEIDEDVSSKSKDENCVFGNGPSLPWSQSKAELNTTQKCTRPVANENFVNMRNVIEEKSKDSPMKNVANVDIFNTSFSSKDLFEFGKTEQHESGKRILTHRKFPGPAGLLPDKPFKELSDVNIVVDNYDTVTTENAKESLIICSQTSVFTEASYKQLISDFDMCKDSSPLKKYTIQWLKKRALKKTVCGKKIPFLAVVLHNVDHSTPDPVLTLRDLTGEIYGTLHRDVWADLGGKLYPGSALALRQVGVLVTGIARKQIYLNITNNNIINIYCYMDNDVVETNTVNKLNRDDLLKSVTQWESVVSVTEPKTPVKLFSTVGGSKVNCVSKNGAVIRKDIKNNEKNKTEQNNFRNSITKTNINNIMEDDFNDLIASLDEDSLNGMSSAQCSQEDLNEVHNVKKRKISMENDASVNSDHKREKAILNKSIPNRNDGFLFGSHPLSQADSQIVEEVLDGINFDDFD